MVEEKKSQGPKPRQRFIVEVDGFAPVKVRFQTFAVDENDALKQLENPRLLSILDRPDIDLSRLSKKRIIIKDGNTSFIKLTKNM